MGAVAVQVLKVAVERHLPASTLYKIVLSCGCRWWQECATSERPFAVGDSPSCYADHRVAISANSRKEPQRALRLAPFEPEPDAGTH